MRSKYKTLQASSESAHLGSFNLSEGRKDLTGKTNELGIVCRQAFVRDLLK